MPRIVSKRKLHLTQEFLQRILDYNPITGIFTWKWRPEKHLRRNHMYAGKTAGTVTESGYIMISVDKIQYQAHILAFIYMTGNYPPSEEVDHKDTKRTNNAWSNLRPATTTQNRANSSLRSDNTSGHKGVTWHAGTQKWRTKLKIHGKDVHVGLFNSVNAAHEAYMEAAHKLFGEYANNGNGGGLCAPPIV